MLDEAEIRKQKREALRVAEVPPYSVDVDRSMTIRDALKDFETFVNNGKELSLVGRIMTIRVHGKLIFAELKDESAKIQILLKSDQVSNDSFVRFRDLVDPADFLQCKGTVFVTQRGERTLLVSGWTMLSKALLPLPEKWHGLQDIEMRFRERELDLLSNPDIQRRFQIRSKLVSSMRRFLDDQGFMEVETPILQPIPGGANARPFITHHQALDIDLYLRIAPEIYLKRLIVGGFEKIYEIGRSFRNEGIDYAHNPEFTSIELYWAYAKKEEYIRFLEDLMKASIQAAVGSLVIPYEDQTIDFSVVWPRVTFREAILSACGIDIDVYRDSESLVAAIRASGLKIDFEGCVGLGEYYDQLFKKTARTKFLQPTWVFDYPIELKPLAGRSPDDATKSACVQLVVQGAEIINAYYHELIDPVDQRERFIQQAALREQGSEEAQHLDESFLRALEHGMPPTSGMAIGIDRLCAFITGAPSIKEVILFPTLRPESISDHSL